MDFPAGFLIGAATAGHQVEGQNTNSDCWALERISGSQFRTSSADAADFYHRWPDDVSLTAALGLRVLRFGVEWSRVEPSEGEFSRAALQHYRRLAAACHDAGLATFVTLNHFTTPLWFAADGGWENPRSVERFTRYCDAVAAQLGGDLDWVATLNEPNLGTMGALVRDAAGPVLQTQATVLAEAGRRHPGGDIGFRPMFMWQGDHLDRYRDAHVAARQAVKEHTDAPVGWTLAAEDYQADPGAEQVAAELRARALDDWLEVSRDDDYVGVQNYTRRIVTAEGTVRLPEGAAVNDMSWEIYPPSLENAVRHAARLTNKPVWVTEHGIATWDDELRLTYTRTCLEGLAAVIAEGVDVRGYLDWTLLDEFEWDAGYDVSFGLVEVDRETFDRTPRPSARWLGDLARSVAS